MGSVCGESELLMMMSATFVVWLQLCAELAALGSNDLYNSMHCLLGRLKTTKKKKNPGK